MNNGDYVLATKYHDGDPGDQYAVGFYDRPLEYDETRHLVVDGSGKQFRNNGFRRVEKISETEGRWLIEHFGEFEPMWIEEDENGDDKQCGKSVWDWLAEYRATAT